MQFKCPKCWTNPVIGYRRKICDECRAKCSKCGKAPRAGKDHLCASCGNIRSREYYKQGKRVLTERQKEIGRARTYARNMIKRRNLPVPELCTVPGCTEAPKIYHRDPTKKMEILWICRTHAIEQGLSVPQSAPRRRAGRAVPEHQAPDANRDDRAGLPPQS
jgi:hypothetical protein